MSEYVYNRARFHGFGLETVMSAGATVQRAPTAPTFPVYTIGQKITTPTQPIQPAPTTYRAPAAPTFPIYTIGQKITTPTQPTQPIQVGAGYQLPGQIDLGPATPPPAGNGTPPPAGNGGDAVTAFLTACKAGGGVAGQSAQGPTCTIGSKIWALVNGQVVQLTTSTGNGAGTGTGAGNLPLIAGAAIIAMLLARGM